MMQELLLYTGSSFYVSTFEFVRYTLLVIRVCIIWSRGGIRMSLERTRYEHRKKKSRNRLLNVSIALVGVLIVFFAIQLFFKSPSEEVISDIEPDEVEQEITEDEDIAPPVVDHTPIEGELLEEVIEEEPQQREVGNQVQNGQWQPIGTVQSEPFVAVYEKDHVNWQEMTKAFQYATGLGEGLIIWRVENGGNHQSAVGIVSTYETRETPYEVRLEWVTNQGWRPVKVESLTNNEFLPNE